MKRLIDRHIEYMNLPYHLKLLRALNKFDLGHVAKYCSTTKRRVWAWENGLAEPTIFQLECLTALYHTSMDLICGTLQSTKIIANQAIVDKEVTVEELMLIRLYRELSRESQDTAKCIIEELFIADNERSNQMRAELAEILKNHDIEKWEHFIQKYRQKSSAIIS